MKFFANLGRSFGKIFKPVSKGVGKVLSPLKKITNSKIYDDISDVASLLPGGNYIQKGMKALKLGTNVADDVNESIKGVSQGNYGRALNTAQKYGKYSSKYGKVLGKLSHYRPLYDVARRLL